MKQHRQYCALAPGPHGFRCFILLALGIVALPHADFAHLESDLAEGSVEKVGVAPEPK